MSVIKHQRKPFIAGTIATYSKIAKGKQGKTNGPYYHLKYIRQGKHTTYYLSRKMAGRLGPYIDNTTAMHKSLDDKANANLHLFLSEGIDALESNFFNFHDGESVDRGSRHGTPGSVQAKRLQSSRDKWKEKCLDRGKQLDKNRITIRDLVASRDKWKMAAKKVQNELKRMQDGNVEKNQEED